MDTNQNITLALTGASGTIYGRRILYALLKYSDLDINLIISDSALRVIKEEENLSINSQNIRDYILEGFESEDIKTNSNRIKIQNNKDIGASIASGTHLSKAMIVCPCSMKTLASIANGLSDNLITRAADVTIKEGRKLIIVPRETPLSPIHLENMLKLSKIGVCILPAMPGFYHRPNSILDLVDMLVTKVLDQISIKSNLVQRWGDEPRK